LRTGFGEDDDEHVQSQRFDQRQTDDQRGTDRGRISRIAGHCFGGARGRLALTQGAETRGDTHTQREPERLETAADVAGGGRSAARRLRKRRHREKNHHRECQEHDFLSHSVFLL
jgi:hypothetical protein